MSDRTRIILAIVLTIGAVLSGLLLWGLGMGVIAKRPDVGRPGFAPWCDGDWCQWSRRDCAGKCFQPKRAACFSARDAQGRNDWWCEPTYRRCQDANAATSSARDDVSNEPLYHDLGECHAVDF